MSDDDHSGPAPESSPDGGFREDILYVQETAGTVHFLLIAYRPGEEAQAAGYLFRRRAGDDGPAENVLATNDPLRELWVSAPGHPWVTSGTGLVWTTAPVPWPDDDDPDPGLEFEVPEGGLRWRHHRLPPQESDGARPRPWSIWGTSDRDVHIGTFGGVLYHWDGERWTQHDPGLGRPLGCIRGRSPGDVYAVGYGSTLLHFDGHRWRPLPDPDGPDTGDILSGIAFAPDGEVLISGRSRGGRILRGSAEAGFTVRARCGLPLADVAVVGDRVFLAAGRSGAAELTPAGVHVLRDDLHPWTVTGGGDGVVRFTISPPEAAYAELDPEGGGWREVGY
ncbi:hypothetical protein ABZX40_22320 [Streptomyces sp. NPDC004610]|uniref:hypothetical protein n=1 Tax=unclassified Streptomyces TaxID=2593676 RepID=UPI00339FF34D